MINERKANDAIVWIDTLATTNVQQGRGRLGNSQMGYCCLGYGCKILDVKYNAKDGFNLKKSLQL